MSEWEDITNLDYYSDIQKKIPGIKVESGYRTKEYQADMRRRGYKPAENSGHLRGEKMDFTHPKGQKWLQQQIKRIYPEAEILDEVDHLDVRFPHYNKAPATGAAVAAGLSNPNRTVLDDWEVIDEPKVTVTMENGPVVDPKDLAPSETVAQFWDTPTPQAGLPEDVELGYKAVTETGSADDIRNFARQNGFQIEDSKIDEFIRQRDVEKLPVGGVEYVAGKPITIDPKMPTDEESFVRALGDPVSLLDEIGAIADSLGATEGRDNIFNTDKRWADLWNENQELNSQITARDFEENPVSTMAGQIISGLPIPFGAKAKTIPELLAVGAGWGLADAAATGENADRFVGSTNIAGFDVPTAAVSAGVGAGITLGLGKAFQALAKKWGGKVVETPEGAVIDVQGQIIKPTADDVASAWEGPMPEFLKQSASRSRRPEEAPVAKPEPVANPKVAEVQKEVSRVQEGWTNKPDTTVVDKLDELPPEVREQIENDGVADDVMGITHDGKVYIFANNVSSPADVQAVTYHESLGHYGLGQMFGEKLDAELMRLYKGNASIRNAVGDLRGQYPEDYPMTTLIEEVLAKQSEGGEIDIKFYEKMTVFVRQLARRMGYAGNISDAEVRAIVRQAQKKVVSGTREDGTPGGTKYMVTYHGTPHDFDEFKLDKIGTGEGAQVYGHGLYFTDTKEIAEGYRDKISAWTSTGDNPGKLYEVELPDDAKWLDWDKPLSEQSPEVQKILYDKFDVGNPPENWGDLTGQQIYADIVNSQKSRSKTTRLTERQKAEAASKALREAGITGNRYLDGFSRRKGEGGYNYVLFDDKAAKIKNKYMLKDKTPEKIADEASYSKDTEMRQLGESYWMAKTLRDTPDARISPEKILGVLEDIASVGKKTGDKGVLAREIYNTLDEAYSKLTGTPLPANNRYMLKDKRKAEVIGGKAGNINLEHIKSTKDIAKYFNEAMEGVTPVKESREDTLAFAETLNMRGSDMKKLSEDMEEMGGRLTRAKILVTTGANQLDTIKKKIDAGVENSDILRREFAEGFIKFSAIVGHYSRAVGGAGRALNALGIDVSGKAGRNVDLRYVLKNMPTEALQTEEGLNHLIKLWGSAPTLKKKAKLARDAFDPKFEDHLFRWQYGMVLSGPETHYANSVGTLANIFADVVSRGAGAVYGQGTRPFGTSKTGDRIFAREVISHLYGLGAGVKKAFSSLGELELKALYPDATAEDLAALSKKWRLGHAWKRGTPSHSVSRMEHQLYDKAPSILKASDLSLRFLAVQDEFFRNMLMTADYYREATRNAVLRQYNPPRYAGDEPSLERSIEYYVNNPTPDMVTQADEYAKRIQFLDKGSVVVQAMEKLRTRNAGDDVPVRIAKAAFRQIFLFLRTPESLVRTALRHDPLSGGFSTTNRQDLKSGGAGKQMVLGRLTFGTALGAYATMMAINGRMTGKEPSDRKEKDAWEAAGKKPYSILNGEGKWVSYKGFEWLSIPLAAYATAVDRGLDDDKTISDAIVATANAVADNVSWFSATRDFFKAFGDEDDTEVGLAGYIASTTSNFVPFSAAIRQTNQNVIDQTRRSTVGDGSLKDRVVGRWMSMVPGLSDNLPAKVDVYGKEQKTTEASILPGMQTTPGAITVSRATASPANTDPVVKELDRLSDVNGSPLVQAVGKSIKVDGETIKLDDEMRLELQTLYGGYTLEWVREEIDAGNWEGLSDEDKLEEVARIKKEAKATAVDELFSWEVVE